MIVYKFLKQLFGISSMTVVGSIGSFALAVWILYLVGLPVGWALEVGLAGVCCVGSFIESRLKTKFPPDSTRPLTYKKGAIAVVLGVIWMVSMIVALIRVDSSSRNTPVVWVGGFGILFLIFGQLEWMWNRDSRLPAKHVSVRKSPNYYQ